MVRFMYWHAPHGHRCCADQQRCIARNSPRLGRRGKTYTYSHTHMHTYMHTYIYTFMYSLYEHGKRSFSLLLIISLMCCCVSFLFHSLHFPSLVLFLSLSLSLFLLPRPSLLPFPPSFFTSAFSAMDLYSLSQ